MTRYELEVRDAAREAKVGNVKASDAALWRAVNDYAQVRHVNLAMATQAVIELGAVLFAEGGVRA